MKTPPKHLSPEMRALLREVAGKYEMTASHARTLQAGCEAFDRAQACRKQIDREGLVTGGSLHPLATEADRATGLFIRAMRALDLLDDESQKELPNKSELARKAVNARWSKYKTGVSA